MKAVSPVRGVVAYLLIFILSGAVAAPIFVEKLLHMSPPKGVEGAYFQLIWYLETATDTYGFYIVNILVTCAVYLILREIGKRFG